MDSNRNLDYRALYAVGVIVLSIAIIFGVAYLGKPAAPRATVTVTETVPIYIAGSYTTIATSIETASSGNSSVVFEGVELGLRPKSWSSLVSLLESLPSSGGFPRFYYGSIVPLTAALDIQVEAQVVGAPLATATAIPTTTVAPTTVQPASPPSSASGKGLEYSSTNVQVAGVDEQDIVKTNGTHIFVARNQPSSTPHRAQVYPLILVYRAYPPSELALLETLNITSTLSKALEEAKIVLLEGNKTTVVGVVKPVLRIEGIYVKGNILVALVREQRYSPIPLVEKTWIVVYDLSGKKNARFMSVTGSLVDTRLLGDTLVVVTVSPTKIGYGVVVPLVNETLPSIDNVYVTGVPETYTIVTAVNIESFNSNSLTIVGPRATTLYMSASGNLYLALNANAIHLLRTIKGAATVSTLTRVFKEELPSVSWDQTILAKIRVMRNATLEYTAYTVVEGRLRKQWQLDEYNNTLRVVVEDWEKGKTIVSLYVFNASNLAKISELKNIAVNEAVHGVRFIGSKLYLVTFRRIDPLFTIDISDPEKPRVIGFLEGPGFDEYLHPIDEKRLVGVGREDRNVRVTLYRVEENGTLKPVSKVYLLSNAVVWSPVLDPRYGHKAFTYDGRHGYILLPILGYRLAVYSSSGNTATTTATITMRPEKISGIAVVEVLEESLEVKGFLDHPNAIRSLYIEDYLYSIAVTTARQSTPTLIAWDANTLEKIGEAE